MKRLVLILAVLCISLLLNSCGAGAPAAVPTISASCAAASVNVNGTVQCTATIANLSSTLVNWQVNSIQSGNSTVGTIDTNGLYTAPKNVPTNNVVMITAVAQAQTTLTSVVNITILPAASISAIACTVAGVQSQTVLAGNSLVCTPTVAGGGNIAVFWYVNNSSACSATLGIQGGNSTVGTIVGTPQGNYVAPLIPPPGGTVAITAVSQADATQTLCITVTPTFGSASLQGNYAFSMSGRATATNGFFLRTGSFVADGSGRLNSGSIEDINPQPSGIIQKPISFTGTYLIGPDGRGTMQFCEPSSSACTAPSSNFRIVVISSTQAQIMQSDVGATAAGEIILQPTASVFNPGSLIGTYSFNFSGVSSSLTEQSEVGEFVADGDPGHTGTGGAITSGSLDINNNGVIPITSGTYTVSSNGRGTATFVTSAGTFTFGLYMVSANHAKFIETDALATLAGDAFRQQTVVSWGINALNSPIVVETTGAGPVGAIADIGSFVADGAGTIIAGSGTLDQNNGGTATSASGLGGTYTLDTSGRGTISIPGHTYVFYMISSTTQPNAVLQETTSGVVAHGLLVQPQGGPFATTSFSGSYALNLTGTNAAGTAGKREDILGQLASNGAGTLTASSPTNNNLDINNFGVTQTGVSINTGTYIPLPAGTLRATMLLNPTRNFVLYLVSPTQFFILDTDTSGVAIGSLNKQF